MEKEKIINILKSLSLLLGLAFIAILVFPSVRGDLPVREENQKEILVSETATTTKEVKTEDKKVQTSQVSESVKSQKNSTVKLPCPSGSTDLTCYMDYYEYIVKDKGVPVAFNVLKADYAVNPYVVSQCHPLTHVIGRVATELYPRVYDAFEHGDPYCWSGYYHGVMEKIIEKIGVEKIAIELDQICDGITGKEVYSFDYYNCVHGLGHGLMAIYDNELFKSLEVCDNLSGVWEQSSCYGGVFMENIIIDGQGEFTKYLKLSDPIYPCNAVSERYKTSCYLMQTSYALKATGHDFAKVFEICRNGDQNYKMLCWQSLGRDASGQSSSNAEATRAKCYLGINQEEKLHCVIGAVKDFISYFHSDVEAKNFCSTLSDDLKQGCLDTAVAYYRSF